MTKNNKTKVISRVISLSTIVCGLFLFTINQVYAQSINDIIVENPYADTVTPIQKENELPITIEHTNKMCNESQIQIEIVREVNENTIPIEIVRECDIKTNTNIAHNDNETINAINDVIIDNSQSNITEPITYNHPLITRGTILGPSGKETWYDLPMHKVLSDMANRGYSELTGYAYWIRDDGVKMLGPYVMVAANLQIRPKGTLVETSLGTGIVCDTGNFTINYPNGIDIATDWRRKTKLNG